MKKLFLCMLTLALLGAGTARAVILQDLFDGDELIVDDKRFFAWELIAETASSGATLPDYSVIEILGLEDDPGTPDPDPGILFETNGQMSVAGGISGEFLDVQLGFAVQSLGDAIKDNSLQITGFDFGSSGGVLTIIEEVFSDVMKTDLIAEKFAEADYLDDPVYDDLFDSAVFDPVDTVWVEKNILVAANPGGTASLDAFVQRFSQVPEPSAFLLIGAGLLPLGIPAVARRRRQRRMND